MTTRPLRRILSQQAIIVAIAPFVFMGIMGSIWLLPQIRSDIEAHQRELATTVAIQIDSYLATSLASVKGVAAIHMNRDLDWHNVQHVLDAQMDASPALRAIYVVGSDGRIIKASLAAAIRGESKELVGLDLSRTALFREVVRRRGPVWSDSFLSIVGGGIEVAVAVPSVQKLTVIAELELGNLTHFIKQVSIGEGQLILLVDRRGQIIADHNGSHTAQQLNISNIPLIRRGIDSQNPQSGEFEFNGQTMTGSLVESPFLKWDVLVAKPTSLVLRPVLTTIGIVASGFAATMLLGIVAALVMARRLAEKFELLASNARQVAVGNESLEWPIVNITEIRQFAEELQLMAAAIRSREHQLLEREQLLRVVMDNTFLLQGLLNPDGQLLEINSAALGFIGKERDSVIGKYFWETPWWSHDPLLQKSLREAIERCNTSQSSRFEVTNQDKDGSVHHIDFSLKPVLDEAGKLIYIIHEGHDITEQKQANEALQASESNYRLLFENMTAGFAVHEMIYDQEGRAVDYRYLKANPAFEKLTGMSLSTVIGRSIKELIPQIEDYWIEQFGKVAQTGIPIAYQNYVQALNKHYDTWVFSPGKGQFAVVFTDDTDRRVAMESLRESEERFHQMFAQNDDGIIIINPSDLRIIDANPSALTLFGVAKEELQQLKPTAFIENADFRRFIKAIPRNDISQGFILPKVTGFRKDGNKIILSVKGKVISLKDKQLILCSIRDIGERIRLEEEIKAAQAKMIQANKMTSLGMLVSGVGHEINNPNQCITTNASVLSNIWRDAVTHLQRIQDETKGFKLGGLSFAEIELFAPQLFSGILDSSHKINKIVSDMRDFVKQENTPLKGTIDVNTVVDSAYSLLWHHIQKYTQKFEINLQKDLPMAAGSSQQIEQVIINLIMNALQSLPDKSHGVSVLTSVDRETAELIITVRDEGKGMSRIVLEQITEPFYTTRSDEGGTGLGLYISSSIIKEHNGTLGFTSEQGKGTTAKIRIPVGI